MPRIQQRKLQDTDRQFDGRIRLWLKGFGLQSVVTVDDVVNALERLPRRHLAGLKEIVYDPARTDLWVADYGQWFALARSKGSFRQSHRSVTLYDFDSKALFYKVLYHEIGHYVFYVVLDSAAKKQWVTELYPRSRYISKIAARNASEDFAECYSAYARAPGELAGIPAKHRFIATRVFG